MYIQILYAYCVNLGLRWRARQTTVFFTQFFYLGDCGRAKIEMGK